MNIETLSDLILSYATYILYAILIIFSRPIQEVENKVKS